MAADRYPTRTTSPQAELLALMEDHDIRPTLQIGLPGSTIDLGAHDKAWRARHGGQPVDPRTMQGLVNRGLVTRETIRRGLRSFYQWRLIRIDTDPAQGA